MSCSRAVDNAVQERYAAELQAENNLQNNCEAVCAAQQVRMTPDVVMHAAQCNAVQCNVVPQHQI